MSKDLTIDQILAIRSVVNLEAPQWSPSGDRLSYVSTLGGQQEIWGISPDGGFPQRQTVNMGTVRFLGISGMKMSPDGKYIAYFSEKTDAAEIWLWSAADGQSRQLTRQGANINAMSWAPDSQSIVFSGNRYGSFDIYRVDVPSGATTRLTSHPLYEVYPVFTPDGQNIVYVRLDERWADHEVIVMPASGGEGKVIATDSDFFDYHYGRTFGYPLVSPDGKTVLFRSHRNGWINYWKVGINGGDPTPLNAEDGDQGEAQWSPDGKTVAYIGNDNGTLSVCLVDANGGNRRKLVAPSLGSCHVPQWSPDGRRIAFLHQTPTQPLDLYTVSVGSGQVTQVTASMPAAVGDRLTAPEKIVYKSFDGLEIPAYVYKPPTIKPGDKFPAIVWVHGGPTNQYYDNYYNYVHFFTRQGYVVMLPNIRGSSGYGKRFEALNDGDWGHDDLKDVLAGVDYLKSLDYVNPDSMGITGTSYGGCMSMSAVGFTQNVFKAAIPMSGYADWEAMYFEQELRHNQLLIYEFGPFETHAHVYRKCSPIHNVKHATTPTFIIHGEGKLPRSSASLDFAKALEKEYKTFKYKAYQGEGYYVQSLPNTRQMWLDMLDWFDRYMKG